MTTITFALAAAFALIHLFIGHLRFLGGIPRSRWLSGAGGVAVAYVFLHILPELAEHGETYAEVLALPASASEAVVYLIAMIGLVAFYGLERVAQASRDRSRNQRGADKVEDHLFWIHIGSFALYNVLIGYLLVQREESGLAALLLYFVAIGFHFVTSDYGLREDHKDSYDRAGRWLIAAAVLAGWALGAVVRLPAIAVGLLFAFLAGGIVLNVLKEELPQERQSRFGPFLAGAVGYSILLMAGNFL